MIIDKSVNLQIIGDLMKNPAILNDTNYSLTPTDFNRTFEKQIFGAIYNLHLNGIEKINVVDIDNYLQNYSGIYQNFTEQNGIEFLQDCEEISTLENFDYYYNKLKKYNLLNDLAETGYDISSIYPNEILDKDYNLKMKQFEEMSLQDIFDKLKYIISSLESQYECRGSIVEEKANAGIEELVKNIQNEPDIGIPLEGRIYNTVVRGARLGKYYIRSAASGTGKSRSMIGEACKLAYPFYYNLLNQKWEYNGSNEKVIYIGTEQTTEEIKTMILAYLTGINEEKILHGFYTEEESNIIKQAYQIMNTFEDNFILCRIPDPDIKSVKATVRRLVLKYDVNYVFYDYIFNSPALMNEMSGTRLREDVVLMMMSTALKDLAVELNVFLQTSTQVTLNPNEVNKMKTASSIRSAKSIADKADCGAILSRVTEDDLKILKDAVQFLDEIPNQVLDIYKLRQGRYSNVRIWSNFDAGCCRRKDLFITDSNTIPIKDFQILDTTIDFDNVKNLDKILQELNGNKIIKNDEIVIDNVKDQSIEKDNSTIGAAKASNKTLDWDDLIG